MIQTPLVSIICTTYNHQAYIKDALEGFIMQKTNFPFEIIVHDDASTDNTASIIKEYQEKFPGLFVNIYQTVNQFSRKEVNIWTEITFPMARGKYIALCEGDDFWTDPLKLQKQVDFLEKNIEYSMVCHDALVMNTITNTSSLFFGATKKKQICSTKDTLNIHFCPTASILFRHQAIPPLSDFNLMAEAGDQALVQLLSLHGLLYRMYDVMSVYRITSTGLSVVSRKNIQGSLEKRINDLKILNKISNYKYQKYIRIENLLIRNRIHLSRSKSEVKTLILKAYRRGLFIVKKNI